MLVMSRAIMKPTSEPIWITEQSRLTGSGPMRSASRAMTKVAMRAEISTSDTASLPRAAG